LIGSATELNASIKIEMIHLGKEVLEVADRIVIEKETIKRMTIIKKIQIGAAMMASIVMKRNTATFTMSALARTIILMRG
jgi:hypothetical protein